MVTFLSCEEVRSNIKYTLSFSSVSVTGVSEASDDSKDHEKKIELSLTASEQSLMMSDDITQCLFSAVENWEMMREKALTFNLPVSIIIYHIAGNFGEVFNLVIW